MKLETAVRSPLDQWPELLRKVGVITCVISDQSCQLPYPQQTKAVAKFSSFRRLEFQQLGIY
jgi:hypothetical protein